jgi:heptosyltransferase-1
MKSALTAWVARGPVSGPAPGPASEPLYAALYRHRVPRRIFEGLDAIEVNRALAAAALGYPRPDSPPSFRLEARSVILPAALHEMAAQAPFAVLVHGSSKAEKAWPEADWIGLGRRLAASGLRCVLPWGSDAERAVAARLASAIGSKACLPPAMPSLVEWVGFLGRAALVVGVDSGLTHLAAASGAPTVALFVSTSPADFGVRADTPHRNLGDGRRPVALGEAIEAAGILLAASGLTLAPSR